jgi:myo-inositol-1-phosphate synthase
MNSLKIGIWLIGAGGRVGTALAVLLAGLQSRTLTTERLLTGFLTGQPEFAPLDLADWSCFVLGGHEIRKTSSLVEARNLFGGATSVSPELLAQAAPLLQSWDRNVRTGTLLNAGPDIESLASIATLKTRGERPSAALRRLAVDFDEFRRSNALDAVIVINVASAEPPAAAGCRGLSTSELLKLLEHADRSPVPTSTLYAAAALQSKCAYLNFTASLGSDLPAVAELATKAGCLHMGREARGDLASLGLSTTLPPVEDGPRRECLQFARTALDVARLTEREQRRGASGMLSQFACFFARPMGDPAEDVVGQLARLKDWFNQVASGSACA